MTQQDLDLFLDSGRKVNERIDEVSYLLHGINRRTYPMGDSEVIRRYINRHKEVVEVDSCDEHPIMGETMTFTLNFPLKYLSLSNDEIKNIEENLESK